MTFSCSARMSDSAITTVANRMMMMLVLRAQTFISRLDLVLQRRAAAS